MSAKHWQVEGMGQGALEARLNQLHAQGRLIRWILPVEGQMAVAVIHEAGLNPEQPKKGD